MKMSKLVNIIISVFLEHNDMKNCEIFSDRPVLEPDICLTKKRIYESTNKSFNLHDKQKTAILLIQNN